MEPRLQTGTIVSTRKSSPNASGFQGAIAYSSTAIRAYGTFSAFFMTSASTCGQWFGINQTQWDLNEDLRRSGCQLSARTNGGCHFGDRIIVIARLFLIMLPIQRRNR